MQVRVITLDKTSSLVGRMQGLFPRADVKIQRGIDVRKTPTQLLFSSDLITHSVVNSLQKGRRWHHEVPTKGAIGLAQANRLALEEDPSQPLLLLEADCNIIDSQKLQREVAQLLFHADKFDMAVFGALYKGSELQSELWLPDGFSIFKDKFWLLHCVLYTPSGRSKVAKLLRKPLEMQIDSLYGAEAMMGNLIVVGQVKNWTAQQYYHPSSVQKDFGGLKGEYIKYSLVAGVVLVLCLLWYTNKESRKQ